MNLAPRSVVVPANALQPARLAVEDISKSFPTADGPLEVLAGINLSVSPGEFVSIIGPSGCGKSSLFNILSGLEPPTSGRVLVDGRDVTGRLGLTAYMPQKDLLLPWKTVLDNTALGMRYAGASAAEARRAALDLFPRFGLEGFARFYPAALSGGMRQRAALLRTILTGREILLLDEPFGALDALTRAQMQSFLLDVWASFEKTIVFVTHDVEEAVYLSDRVFVLTPRPGRVVAEFSVDIPRPRPYEDTVVDPEFVALRRELFVALRGGVR